MEKRITKKNNLIIIYFSIETIIKNLTLKYLFIFYLFINKNT